MNKNGMGNGNRRPESTHMPTGGGATTAKSALTAAKAEISDTDEMGAPAKPSGERLFFSRAPCGPVLCFLKGQAKPLPAFVAFLQRQARLFGGSPHIVGI